VDRLDHRDVTQIFTYLLDLHRLRDRSGCLQHILTSLGTVIPCDRASYNEMDVTRGRVTYVWSDDRDHLQEKMLPVFRHHMHEHPAATYAQRSGEVEPVKISDFVTARKWHKLALYQEYYRPLGVEDQLSVALSANPNQLIPIALNRPRRNFTERDRLVLRILRPHLAQVLHNADAVTRFHQELEGLRWAVDELKIAVVELTPKETIHWASKSACNLMMRYWPDRRQADRLPDILHRWVCHQRAWRKLPDRLQGLASPLVVDRGDAKLVVRFVPESEKGLLFFEENSEGLCLRSEETAGLTPREREMLVYLAQGKTNQEIAGLLGISTRTVAKHLERVFEKLGVETRTAAACALKSTRD